MLCVVINKDASTPIWQQIGSRLSAVLGKNRARWGRRLAAVSLVSFIATDTTTDGRASDEPTAADRSIVVASDRHEDADDHLPDEAIPQHDPKSSDREKSDADQADDYSNPSASAVARDLGRIQQSLGGSILRHSDVLRQNDQTPTRDAVAGRPGSHSTVAGANQPHLESVDRSILRGSSANIQPRRSAQTAWATSSVARPVDKPADVVVLRDSAAQLERTANQLESLELYGQADALRAVAQQFRLDARHFVAGRSVSPRAVQQMPEYLLRGMKPPAAWQAELDAAAAREPTPALDPTTASVQSSAAD